MNSSPAHSSSDYPARSHYGDHDHNHRSTVSWGAIFAGAVAALGVQVLLMMLGAGLGLAVYSPLTESDPMANLSIGALLIQSISAIISLCLGGWVAGRFAPVHCRATGWLHGFTVWCTATVGGVILVALGAGMMLGGLSKIISGGLSAAGQPVAAVAGGAADLASTALKQSEDTITSFVEEAVSSLPDDISESEKIRATREVGLALGRLFNPLQDGNTAANRSDAITALVEHTEMGQTEAENAVNEWTTTYEELQDDLAAAKETAVTQAREAADTAASALATASLWSFFAFLLGALAAAGGGFLGAQAAMKCEETTDDEAYSGHDTSDSDRPKRHIRDVES